MLEEQKSDFHVGDVFRMENSAVFRNLTGELDKADIHDGNCSPIVRPFTLSIPNFISLALQRPDFSLRNTRLQRTKHRGSRSR